MGGVYLYSKQVNSGESPGFRPFRRRVKNMPETRGGEAFTPLVRFRTETYFFTIYPAFSIVASMSSFLTFDSSYFTEALPT